MGIRGISGAGMEMSEMNGDGHLEALKAEYVAADRKLCERIRVVAESGVRLGFPNEFGREVRDRAYIRLFKKLGLTEADYFTAMTEAALEFEENLSGLKVPSIVIPHGAAGAEVAIDQLAKRNGLKFHG